MTGPRRDAADDAAQLEQLSFLDSVIENIPAMVFVKDAAELRFVRFNRAGEDLLGYSRDELIGKNDEDFFPTEQARAFTAADREVLASGLLVEIAEEPIETRHRGRRILHTKKIPIIGPDGEPRYLLGISEDITDLRDVRREAEQARHDAERAQDAAEQARHEAERAQAIAELAQAAAERAQSEAERANDAKSQFLSRMSHELRTPLNVILGYSQLLATDDVPQAVIDGVGQIHTAGRHLLDMINEILDISRIETGRLGLSVEPVELDHIVREVLTLLAPLAAARQVTIDLATTGQHFVLADRQRLRQVLINLVTNAVKYNTPEGYVRVEVTEELESTIRVSVTDTGPGIAADLLHLLFQPFERLGVDARGIEGTGLGLALSKGLTEAMGGTIGAASELGAGSTFWVELPTSATPPPGHEGDEPPESWSHAGGPERTILYVEDNESNIRLIDQVVRRRPSTSLVVAMRGAEAVELARSVDVDLVLLDLNLPDLHGSEVLQRLKDGEDTRHLPVVVLTADATPGRGTALRAAGAADYLTKPVDLRQLYETLDRLLGEGPAEGDAEGDAEVGAEAGAGADTEADTEATELA